ncbi:unnamed protein product [Amaranthus hypochondriacus]
MEEQREDSATGGDDSNSKQQLSEEGKATSGPAEVEKEKKLQEELGLVKVQLKELPMQIQYLGTKATLPNSPLSRDAEPGSNEQLHKEVEFPAFGSKKTSDSTNPLLRQSLPPSWRDKS